MIKDTIKQNLILAMKAKNEIAKNTLKGLLSAFTNEVIANGGTPQTEISDEIALKIIKRSVKQRKDAIAQFLDGGRKDLAENEKQELEILEKYLPAQLSEEEIKKIAESKKDELQITDISKIGILIGQVVKETNGNADGALVSKVVKSLFD